MQLIFVRHGHYAEPVAKADRDREPLSAQGQEGARTAGTYIEQQGIVPDLVVTTRTCRTVETADLICETLGLAEVPRLRDGGFSAVGGITEKAHKWSAARQPAARTILFVGHHSSRNAVARLPGAPPIPRGNHACVLICEPDTNGAWRCSHAFPGTSPTASPRRPDTTRAASATMTPGIERPRRFITPRQSACACRRHAASVPSHYPDPSGRDRDSRGRGGCSSAGPSRLAECDGGWYCRCREKSV